MSAEYEENDINAEYDQNLNFIGGEIKVGDEVYVDTLDKVGKVTAVNKNGEYEIMLGAVKTKVKAKNCKRLAPTKSKSQRVSVSKAFSNAQIKTEINLLGKTVDEAIFELDPFLYQASEANVPEVRVVHGKGTGALRKGVQAYLKGHPCVKEFRDGVYGEGDNGVTMVKIK